MVFSGPELEVAYELALTSGRLTFRYRPELSLGTGFSHRITGYNIGFKPLDAAFAWTLLCTARHSLAVGCGTRLSYQWQMYPNLHNSHLFAQAEVPVCVLLEYGMKFRDNAIRVEFENSIFGWAGQLPRHDPYAYSLSFSEFALRPLRSLKFGSFADYLATRLSALWSMDRLPGHAFGIGLSYRSIGPAEKHQKLTFALLWKKRF